MKLAGVDNSAIESWVQVLHSRFKLAVAVTSGLDRTRLNRCRIPDCTGCEVARGKQSARGDKTPVVEFVMLEGNGRSVVRLERESRGTDKWSRKGWDRVAVVSGSGYVIQTTADWRTMYEKMVYILANAE